jgi:hypothetical protein
MRQRTDQREQPRRHAWAALASGVVGALALLAGCAGYSPEGLSPGASSAAVIQQMGAPTGRYTNPDGGQRLEFARGPAGRHTYMVDFDVEDRMREWAQVLNESDFYELRPGMTKEEVLYRIGHPSDVRYLSRQQHQLWSYRYESPFCVWFQVSVDRAGRVAELGHNTDPACDPPDYF